MRILIILHRMKKRGGAVLQIQKLAKEMEKKGNKIHIFSMDQYSISNSFIQNSIISMKSLKKIISKFKPDIILASDPYITNTFAKICNITNSAIIVRIGAVFDDFYAARIYYKLFGSVKISILYRVISSILRIVSYFLLRNNTLVIFNSSFLKRKFQNVVPNSIVIHNGVSTVKKSKQLNYCDQIKLIYVGRIEPRKSIEILIESLYYLKKERVNFSFSLVGNVNYDIKYWKKLEKLIDKYQLKNQVHVVGEIDNIKLSDFLQKHDILLFSTDSRNFPITEGLPNVILEGMATGLAIITTSVAGVPEIISSKNGIIVSPDAKAFTEAIKFLATNKTQLNEIKNYNYKVTRKKHHISKVADKYLATFKNQINYQ